MNYDREVLSILENNQKLQTEVYNYEKKINISKNMNDSLTRLINNLNETNLNLQIALNVLYDSIAILNKKIQYTDRIQHETLSKHLNSIKSEFFYMDDFPEEKKLVQDSLFEKCDDDRCAYILVTDDYLVASYIMSFGNDFGTIIIELSSQKNLLIDEVDEFFVDGYDKNKNLLIIGSSGYDNNGRYWRNGTWSFSEKIVRLGKKEY